ncbi:hypothetical protein [Halomarina oriensis]|uniref:Uncharacterized protein n=1 Tax=Halomarina oriensis TaxID=671145 RepID=A0A6B0GPG4_9EURY|nr:hypothetical protein [Halomarina oriensis]MWG36610.1 hypothetical protein [Halomarina oriensis]
MWTRINEKGVSNEYAQTLVSRTDSMLLNLTNYRLYDELRCRRKDGLRYKEKRLVVPPSR